jgi:hypothetical protein
MAESGPYRPHLGTNCPTNITVSADLEGLLEDGRWRDFLRYRVTLHACSQVQKPIPFLIINILRLNRNRAERDTQLQGVMAELQWVADQHVVDIEPPPEGELGLTSDDVVVL